jgi:flagellar biosynthesis protein FlhG
LRLQNRETEVQIIVNQAENQREGLHTYNNILKACENFLKFTPKLAGVIRKDPKVKDSIRSQKPTLVKNPRSIAAADVAALSVKLMAK